MRKDQAVRDLKAIEADNKYHYSLIGIELNQGDYLRDGYGKLRIVSKIFPLDKDGISGHSTRRATFKEKVNAFFHPSLVKNNASNNRRLNQPEAQP
jgi:hypothetical protein